MTRTTLKPMDWLDLTLASPLRAIEPRRVTRRVPEAVGVTATAPAEIFMQLTRYTCPHGCEERMYGQWLQKAGWQRDGMGNYHRQVGQSRSIFAAHLDTVGYEVERVKRRVSGGIAGTNGKTILGADDKAGVTVVLSMVQHEVPGHYVLFVGEERGGIGSERVCHEPQYRNYDRMICFDRAGFGDVITRQAGGKCCSDEFAAALALRLNVGWVGEVYRPCDTGIFTDSANFTDTIPECTNLSVGYFHAHSPAEVQHMGFLDQLCSMAVLLDWESLPTVRKPGEDDDSLFDCGYYPGRFDMFDDRYRTELLLMATEDPELRPLVEGVGERCFDVYALEYLLEYSELPPDLRDILETGLSDRRSHSRTCAMCGDPVSDAEALFSHGQPFCCEEHLSDYEGEMYGA